jgi:hypothetical protein
LQAPIVPQFQPDAALLLSNIALQQLRFVEYGILPLERLQSARFFAARRIIEKIHSVAYSQDSKSAAYFEIVSIR